MRAEMSHALRPRDANVDRQQKLIGPGGKHKNVLGSSIHDSMKDEPKAKRPALQHITNVLGTVEIDSAKKRSQPLQSICKPDSRPRLLELADVEAAAELEVDPAPEVDFDRENANDPNAVSEYACDIFRYCKFREKFFTIPEYFKRHQASNQRLSVVSPSTRAAIVDWMVEVQESFEMNHETLYMAVKLLDIYLSRCPRINRSDVLQLAAAGAVFVCAKLEERSPPAIADLVLLASNRFDEHQLKMMEMDFMKTVRFDLCCPLSYSFLRRYGRVIHADMPLLTLSRYILELSLHFVDFCRQSDSKIAAASLLLALRMMHIGDWNAVLHKYSTYTVEDIEPLMYSLNHMLHCFQTKYPRLQTVVSKYSHPIFFEVANTKPLADIYSRTAEIRPPN